MDFKSRVLECLGKFPEKVEIHPEIVQTVDKETHILQTVCYSVEEDERINAYLLLPKQLKKNNPAIIAAHQHAGEYYLGKAEPAGLSSNTMYHYGLDLCLRGYVVLCPDHLCFEDRRPVEFRRIDNPNLNGSNYERLMFCKYILKGSTLQAKYISDLCRGVDFLQSLDFVDNERIGAIGHSLGGQETLWTTWYDKRIKVAVSSCGFSQISRIVEKGINHNFAMFTPGFLNVCDMGDIVCDIAPRPFMMTNGSRDSIFPLEGVKEIAEAVRKTYADAGVESNFRYIIFDNEHCFPHEVKSEAYEWLDRFLLV